MKNFYKVLFVVLCAAGFSASAVAQDFFRDASESSFQVSATAKRVIIPKKYRTVSLNNTDGLKAFLWSLPSEKDVNRLQAPILELPMPDGKTARFRVWESSVQEPALEAKFPEIKTFAGQGIDDPYATIRFDYNPYFGFSAQILSIVSGRIYIDPYARGDIKNYISYYHRDNTRRSQFKCGFDEEEELRRGIPTGNIVTAGPCRGTELRTYRLAVACTGEYAVAVGGGVAGPTHAAIVTSTNRITGVYEVELAIRLVLIGNNNLIEYLNGATDPFVNTINTALLNANQTNTDAVIGSANYDIGHIFTSDDNGLAQLSAVCGSGKARGATGAPVLVGDGFDIDYVAHEMGHQFGAPHTFNSNTCASTGGSYEPGGGTTIMAYAGICAAAENIQPNSDPIFHASSFDAISNYLLGGGGTCGVVTTTGNTLPVITAMNNNNISIPINTPFVLSGTATDADGDPISYNWEGWDIGAAGTWPSAANSTTRPLFRTRVSKTTGSRTFPDMRVIAANYPLTAAPSQMDGLRGEVLPAVARTMKFRLTVRDNRAGGGGVVSGGEGCQANMTATFQVQAVGTTPFTVSVPNGGESYGGGSTQTVTWDPAGTTAAPFNVANVKISFSTDGGLTFPTTLVASTANDGSESVTIPVGVTSTARIKVEAIGNIFFDISNNNFNVTAATTPTFQFVTPSSTSVACGGPAFADITLNTSSVAGFSTPITLTNGATPAGTNITYTVNPVTPGNSTVVRLNNINTLGAGSYAIVITGTAGAEVKQVTLTYIVTAGAGPAITAHPTSQSLCAGGNVSFAVASAAATAFQWQYSTDGGANWNSVPAAAPYSGTTTNTLTITGVTGAMNGHQFRALASVTCGSTTSNVGTLTVNTAPAVTSNPVSASICDGSSTSFSVAATGAGLSYQWQISTDGGANYTNIPAGAPYSGINTNTLTINPVTLAMNNNRYRCVVSGTCTPSPATSTGATLTVIAPVTVATNPTDATVCTPGNTSFTASGNSTVTVIYQWQVSTDGGANWTNVANGGVYGGATTGTLSLTGVPLSMNGYRYRVQMSNATCITQVPSNSALLTVQVAPSVSANPSDVTLCTGSPTSFSITATGTNITYQWQVSTDGGANWTNVPAAAPYSGVTTNTLTINPTAVSMNGYRYRNVVSGSCNPAANSNAAILTVIAPVAITTQPVATAVCNTYNTSFSVAGSSTVAISYQWQVSTDGGANWTNVSNGGVYSGATTNTLNITGAASAMNGYRYRVLLSNATCTSPTISSGVVLTVNALPNVTATANPTSVCTGTPAVLTAAGADTYTWGSGTTPSTGAVVTVTPVVNPANPSVPATTTYSVVGTITATGCFNSATVPVIAEPLPVVTLSPANPAGLLPGQSVTLTTTIVPAGGNFTLKWFKDGVDMGFNGTSRVITVNELGKYKVTVANAITGLCSTTSNEVTVSAAPSSRLFIYPSPNNGKFTVAYYNSSTTATQQGITIYDSKGSRVYNSIFPVNQPYQLHAMDLRRNGKGIYFVVLRDASGKAIKTGEVMVR